MEKPITHLSGLYGITDDSLLSDDKLLNSVESALSAGCKILQYRSKIEDWQTRVAQAAELQGLCEKYQVPLIINDSIELCAEVNAAGVHLGKSDGSIVQAREILGPDKIIGVTCHDSVEAAIKAESEGADYVAFGRFFSSITKPDASPAEIRVLTAAKEKLSIPVVAIGGINAENGASLIEAGADMLAVINAIFATDQVAERTAKLVRLFD